MGITPFTVEERVNKYRKKKNEEEIATSARSERNNNKDAKDFD